MKRSDTHSRVTPFPHIVKSLQHRTIGQGDGIAVEINRAVIG